MLENMPNTQQNVDQQTANRTDGQIASIDRPYQQERNKIWV